jgi:hypothetical protein
MLEREISGQDLTEAQLVAEVVKSGHWSNPDPEKCSCKGGGWILHPSDVWMECPDHPGRRHPEDYRDEEEFGGEEWDREYTNYVSTTLWNDRYTDWSDQYTWEMAEDDIPF